MCGPKQKVLVLGQGFGNLGPDLLCEQKSVGPAYHMGSSEKEEPFPECWERGMFRRYVSGYVSGCVSGYVSHEIVVVVVAAAVVVAIVVVVVVVVVVAVVAVVAVVVASRSSSSSRRRSRSNSSSSSSSSDSSCSSSTGMVVGGRSRLVRRLVSLRCGKGQRATWSKSEYVSGMLWVCYGKPFLTCVERL